MNAAERNDYGPDQYDIFALVRLGHLVVTTFSVFAKRASRREPLRTDQQHAGKVP